MYRTVVISGLLILGGAVASQSLSSATQRADFTYVNPSDLHTLDPARMSWTQDFRVALNLWEGLTRWDPLTLEPRAGVAVFPPERSSDGTVYTFRIREDARWSDGSLVTASDFVRGWRRLLEPGTGTDYAVLLTDRVVGARDYVRWRRDGLRELDRASHGLSEFAGAERWTDRESDDSLPEALAPISGTKLNPGERLLVEQVSEMDERFASVGIRSLDERTLEVRLLRPCPYFLDLTAFPALVPCHRSIELLRERYHGLPLTREGLVVYDPQWTKPDYRVNGYPGLITNGPYQLREWRFKSRARLAVNSHHRDADRVACRTVDMVVIENVNASLMAYEAGEIDFLPSLDVAYVHELVRLSRNGTRRDILLSPTLSTFFFAFNCASAQVGRQDNPFVDARVRRAFALALDKRQLVEGVLRRGDRIAATFVPPGALGDYEPPAGLGLNLDQARALLAESGYPGGSGLPPIDLLHVASDTLLCQASARMWEEGLGVRIELRSLETKTFAEEKAHRRFMIARGNWYGDYQDATTFLDCLMTNNGNNDSGYHCSEYDALLRRADTASDPTDRAVLLREAEQIIVERDLPVVPILHYVSPMAVQPYVSGLHPNSRLIFPFDRVQVRR